MSLKPSLGSAAGNPTPLLTACRCLLEYRNSGLAKYHCNHRKQRTRYLLPIVGQGFLISRTLLRLYEYRNNVLSLEYSVPSESSQLDQLAPVLTGSVPIVPALSWK